MPQRLIDLTDQRFGRLRVVRRVPKQGGSCWLVICDCGVEKTVAGISLRSGDTQSCGCLHRERSSQAKRTHGHTHVNGVEKRSVLYVTWRSMITRCTNPKNSRWDRYGGRGIRLCDRWRRDFTAFAADMGERPSTRHSIDRIDPDGDYTPKNCRWATIFEQRHNRSRLKDSNHAHHLG